MYAIALTPSNLVILDTNEEMCAFFHFFYEDYFLRVVLDSQKNWKAGTKIIHISSDPHIHTASPIINIPHQVGTFVTTGEPTVTHHSHLRSVVYITAHSWWCTFCIMTSIHHFTVLKILCLLISASPNSFIFIYFSYQHWPHIIVKLLHKRILILCTCSNLRWGKNMKIRVLDLLLTFPAPLPPPRSHQKKKKKRTTYLWISSI